MNKIQKEELNILLEFDRICKKHELKYSLAYGTLLGAVRHQGFIPWDDDIDVMMIRSEYDKFCTIVQQELDSNDYIFVDNRVDQKFYYGFSKIRSKHIMMPERSTSYLGIEQGVWIDIFPYDAVPNDPVLALKQKKKVKFYHNLMVAFVFTYPSKNDSGITKIIKSLFSNFNRLTRNWVKPRQMIYNLQFKQITKYNDSNCDRNNSLGSNFTEREYAGGMLSQEQLSNLIQIKFEGNSMSSIKDYDSNLTGVYGDYMTPPKKEDQVSVHDVTVER